MEKDIISSSFQIQNIFNDIEISISNTILYAIFAVLLIAYFIVSVTIVYHLRKFSVGIKGRIIAEIVYFSFSIILILFMFVAITLY